jgi:transcription elongation factor Elf1
MGFVWTGGTLTAYRTPGVAYINKHHAPICNAMQLIARTICAALRPLESIVVVITSSSSTTTTSTSELAMGKRKSRTSKLTAKPKKQLETDFTCPFCSHPGSVQCDIFLKERRPFAVASCSICTESYATKAHALTEPIDVYSEWIDSCREANKGVVAPRPDLDGEAKRRRKTQDDGS